MSEREYQNQLERINQHYARSPFRALRKLAVPAVVSLVMLIGANYFASKLNPDLGRNVSAASTLAVVTGIFSYMIFGGLSQFEREMEQRNGDLRDLDLRDAENFMGGGR